MTEEIPQWAKERTCGLINNELPHFTYAPKDISSVPSLRAFARYIAAHEEEPVDPDREEALALVLGEPLGRTDNQIAAIKNGQAGECRVALALAAIKRGRELERGG